MITRQTKRSGRWQDWEVGLGNTALLDLFKYAVMEDQEAGERQLKALRQFIGTKPEPLTWDRDPASFTWNVDMPSSGDRHQRDEQSLNVFRYDILYHLLTEEERQGVEDSFKSYIQFHLDGAQPRHPAFKYTRIGWLPNMHWPRVIGTHLMAVAMADEEAIKAMFESDGGFKWYFDDYIADGRFYMEEFAKYYSNIGSMIFYCEGLEELGLNQYGYGYTGKGGATMRKYLNMMIDIGYPATDIPGGSRFFGRVAMGDAKGKGALGYGMGQHSIINGRFPDNSGGEQYWSRAHMNGPLPKMLTPFWFELGHKRWPEDGFGYFLGEMRGLDEEVYLPSLFWPWPD